MSDSNPVNQEVEQFNKQKLKKTNTQEKNHLPTKEGRSLRQKKCAPNKPHLLLSPFPFTLAHWLAQLLPAFFFFYLNKGNCKYCKTRTTPNYLRPCT